MNEMKYPPRQGDLPREELLKMAQKETGPKGRWAGADVYFKYTCQWCGERCMLQEPNTLFENGECSTCGKVTKIDFGGFTIHLVIGKKEQSNEEKTKT